MSVVVGAEELATGSPYVAYTYSYPHKTAHRPFDPPLALRDVWSEEKRDALFLYLHVPFCEMRCGFCNLFTLVPGSDQSLVTSYLAALREQAVAARESLPDARFARLAIGGGTPTFLEPAELEELFAIATDVMGGDVSMIPSSVETSPTTATADRLGVLRERGVGRVSLGVQTFDEAEAKRLARPQRTGDVERALDAIRSAGFATLNIDLIYGGEGQTTESWLASIRRALHWRPEEIYLYPLYVRPLTSLGKLTRSWDDQRLEAYRAGRALLLESGYTQISMRMFRTGHAAEKEGPVYCCQEDGMLGLGCGARSYTRGLHYSSQYAVGRSGIREIIAAYIQQNRAARAYADHGCRLDAEDQRRRFIIMSVLQSEGLDLAHFARRFGSDAFANFPELSDLMMCGLAVHEPGRMCLTAAGLERSDAIGPWLCSDRVRKAMEGYAWR